jgi:antirestriction protein ArdC
MTTRFRRDSGSDKTPRDHYAAVTDQVIAALEAGTPPWRRPWDPDKAGGPCTPRNATTGARYRGINVVTLGMSPLAFCTSDPRWATYKQAADKGWQVKKGERGTTAYFFKRIEVRDGKAADSNGEEGTRRIPLLRAFTLFHASQIEGVPDFVPPTIEEAPWRAPEAAELIITNSRAVIRVGGDRAFYSPVTDHIQMPPLQAFHTPSGYSGCILHELGHWSGAKERLDRDLHNASGSHDYAREELRAEIAQVMVSTELGIPDCDFTNNVSYLASWLEKLRSDRKEIFRAAADAQRIADYLLAFHPDYAARNNGGGEAIADTGDATSGPSELGDTLAEAA